MSIAKKPKLAAPHFPGDDELPDWVEDPILGPDDDPTDDDVIKPRNPALKPRKRPRPKSKKCRVGRKRA